MAYMLITVSERDIYTSKHNTYESARDQMMRELWNEFYGSRYDPDDDGETWDYITSLTECDEYADDGYGFAFSDMEAWSNIDSSYNFDWKIVEI